MRVSKVIIEHFKGVSRITTSLEDGVFYICGMNESGKSSFLDGLTFALLGKKAFPKGKWREITSTSGSKTLTSCVLVDDDGNEKIKITRKINKSGNESAVIERTDGKRFSQHDLDLILDPIALNPKAFMEMPAREQALFLGIDTAELDAKYKGAYQDRQFIGRDVKRLKGAVEESYCEKSIGNGVDIDELYQKLHSAGMNNNDKANATDQISAYKDQIADLQGKIMKLEPIANQPIEETDLIEKEIERTKANQGLIQQHEAYETHKANLEIAQAEYEKKTYELDGIKEDKIAKIKSTKLPFKNLTTNDDGELVVVKEGKEMPFNSNFFSTGKMWEMSIKILAAQDTELKLVIVKDATLLDENKVKAITETAKKKGLQVLLEYVGEVEGKNSITLTEGRLK